MLVDIQVTRGLELQIEATVLRKKFKHVIEEADARRDFIAPATLDGEAAANLRFFGVALDGSGSHGITTRSIWLMSSRIATAFSALRTSTSSSYRGFAGAAIPMNGAPASRAQRASSTVSPIYQCRAGRQSSQIFSNPSGAGLGRVTSSAPTMSVKRRCAAQRLSVSSASQRRRPVNTASWKFSARRSNKP